MAVHLASLLLQLGDTSVGPCKTAPKVSTESCLNSNIPFAVDWSGCSSGKTDNSMCHWPSCGSGQGFQQWLLLTDLFHFGGIHDSLGHLKLLFHEMCHGRFGHSDPVTTLCVSMSVLSAKATPRLFFVCVLRLEATIPFHDCGFELLLATGTKFKSLMAAHTRRRHRRRSCCQGLGLPGLDGRPMEALADSMMPTTSVWVGAGFSSWQTAISSGVVVCIISLKILGASIGCVRDWVLTDSSEVTGGNPDCLSICWTVDTAVACDEEKGTLLQS